MVAVPHTYADWSRVLDLLVEHTQDEEVLRAMKQGTLEWQSGVAERFAKKLTDAINKRMNNATDKFQKSIGRSYGEGDTIRALLTLRKELAFAADAIDLPAIPEKDRAQYVSLVRAQADAIQKSLEESAAKIDRTGKMSSIIRNHKVNAF